MRKIKSYRVLSGAGAKSLEEQVIDLQQDGYELVGGVSVTYATTQSYLRGGGTVEAMVFSQAMALYESEGSDEE